MAEKEFFNTHRCSRSLQGHEMVSHAVGILIHIVVFAAIVLVLASIPLAFFGSLFSFLKRDENDHDFIDEPTVNKAMNK